MMESVRNDSSLNADWWDSLPDNIKADIDESVKQADKRQVMTHEEVKKKYPKLFGNSVCEDRGR